MLLINKGVDFTYLNGLILHRQLFKVKMRLGNHTHPARRCTCRVKYPTIEIKRIFWILKDRERAHSLSSFG